MATYGGNGYQSKKALWSICDGIARGCQVKVWVTKITSPYRFGIWITTWGSEAKVKVRAMRKKKFSSSWAAKGPHIREQEEQLCSLRAGEWGAQGTPSWAEWWPHNKGIVPPLTDRQSRVVTAIGPTNSPGIIRPDKGTVQVWGWPRKLTNGWGRRLRICSKPLALGQGW